MADKILDRLAKILTQAERAPEGSPERDAFMTKAQALATDHAIDLAIARQHTAKKEQREQPEVRRINTAQRGEKNAAKKVNLILAIAAQNDVKCNIYHDSTGIIAFGFPSDIDVVEALYGSLVVQMTLAGDEYVASKAYVGETYYGEIKVKSDWGYTYTDWGKKKVDGRVARASFYDGFTHRIQMRLSEARREAVASYHVRRALEPSTPGEKVDVASSGAELALVEKEVEVRDFYQEKSTAKGSWRGGSNQGGSSSGRSAGDAAGSRARLSAQKALG